MTETDTAELPSKSLKPQERILIDEIVEGRIHDPFAYLGRHREGRGNVVRVFYPDAVEVRLVAERKNKPSLEKKMDRIDERGIYAASISVQSTGYSLRILWADGWQETHDPYSFGTLIGDLDLYLFAEGNHRDIDQIMGAHICEIDGISGVRFTVWAPNAHRVSVIGDFNIWDGRRHPMRLRHSAGIWELFVPGIGSGERYKFEIMAQGGVILPAKADPYARYAELPPATASIVAPPLEHDWHDQEWMAKRAERQALGSPISIYELHVPSWQRRNSPTGYISWNDLGDQLIPYVSELGFTHIELMPITEYPFSGSWGYQPLSMYAPTSRHGTPAEFAHFVDRCHQANIGVIMDWVPAHFPADAHGLALFDGTHLYEHSDPKEGYHQDWHTLIYNFGRTEIRNFLTGSALYWLRNFHLDGLRVDAVASMLYRDYSRKDGEWCPNIYGGRENLEAVSFMRELSGIIRDYCHDAALIAEESTAWPGVTSPAEVGGLGFRFKWNMGWMHDTLRYMQHDPLWRRIMARTSRSEWSTPIPSISCFPCRMTKSCMAKGPSCHACRGTTGVAMPICAPITRSCGPIQAKSFFLWEVNSPSGKNGIMTANWPGTECTIPWGAVCSTRCARSMPCTGRSPRSRPAISTMRVFAGSSPMTRKIPSLRGCVRRPA